MPPAQLHPRIAALREAGETRVKVAASDIDGVLRGKLLHIDKFESASTGGFGFCDVVFGWDSQDVTYDNTQVTGWQHGFPDTLARIDPDTARRVPWDGDVPFFLAEFISPDGSPFPLCPRQTLRRVLARAEKLGFAVMTGFEFEWFNFRETPHSWAAKRGVDPEPITPGMFGYSLLRMADHPDFFRALMDEMAAFGVPIEGLHTETGPGVLEAALLFSPALEQADRAILFKTGAREIGKRFGIMPSFMAKWSAKYPGCSGHIHQSLSDGQDNVFFAADHPRRMSPLFESYLAGQVQCLMEFAPLFWPTVNSYKRLVDGFWAPVKPTWGMDNRTASFRVLAGSPKATRLETRCPGADVNPYLAMAAVIAAGLHGVEQGLKLTAPPITGTNQGAEGIARAPRTLIETTRVFERSAIARDWLGDTFVEHFAATRDWEWRQWLDAVTDWERQRYFEII
ncbi:glutamine synthetase family protein [Ramlibacter rhizophilus]|uniref:Glutamine synthetase n=1 Tax=Ramlibacter rhizophilus TaxID=1781167 RepID=A0A4Z0BPC4_9BURK|nr:glutamine synthetase family protein [Ramlibacter rhizophilus]TFY99904.1 glutamine synthetase [Ramlibacter rhizophilus]